MQCKTQEHRAKKEKQPGVHLRHSMQDLTEQKRFVFRSIFSWKTHQDREYPPVDKLQKIRKGVPETVITKEWDSVIFGLFLEKGDTAYARDGYHDAVKLIEKHLLEK